MLPACRIGALPAAASAFLPATASGNLLLPPLILSNGVEPVEADLTAAAVDLQASRFRLNQAD